MAKNVSGPQTPDQMAQAIQSGMVSSAISAQSAAQDHLLSLLTSHTATPGEISTAIAQQSTASENLANVISANPSTTGQLNDLAQTRDTNYALVASLDPGPEREAAKTALTDSNRAYTDATKAALLNGGVIPGQSAADPGASIPSMTVYSNQGQSSDAVVARLRQEQGIGQSPDIPDNVTSAPTNATSDTEDLPVPPVPPDQIPPVTSAAGTSLSSNPVLSGSSSAQVNVSDQRIRLTPKDMSILSGGGMSSLSSVSNAFNSLSLNPTGYLASLIPNNPTLQSSLNSVLSTTNSSSTGQSLMYPLIATNGFMFPYTPQIQYTGQANYGTQNMVHSNQEFRYYQNTASTTLTISGPFSAQTKSEAAYLLACLHFLRVVTKMRFGQSTSAGAPPPVLVLNGYGNAMFYNLPVIITNFIVDMPNNVDYIETNSAGLSGWVPIYTTVTVTCVVQNTPNKLRTFDWDAFAKGTLLQQGGWS